MTETHSYPRNDPGVSGASGAPGASWHAHREAPDCRVYGRRLEIGELIEPGDLFESQWLRAWAPTQVGGQRVPVDTARAYVRPVPEPRTAREHQHVRSGRTVLGYDLAPGELLRPGDLFAGGADWIRTLRPGQPAYTAGYVRPVLTSHSEGKGIWEMQAVEIRRHDNNHLLFVTPAETDDPAPLRTALTRAVRQEADLNYAALAGAHLEKAELKLAQLCRADLTRADLTQSDLRCARLVDATLTGATLAGADLSEAALAGADLTRANLRGANLFRADLTGADLTGADLTGAKLTCADLERVRLDRTNLERASLDEIRRDLWAVLDQATPVEVVGLLKKLQAGEVDGTCYEGDCACLIGTVAKIRGCSYNELRPDGSRPAERWMLAVQPGDKPSNNPVARITQRWIAVWLLAKAQMQMIVDGMIVESLLPPPLRHPAIMARMFGIS